MMSASGAVMEVLFPPFRLDLAGERLWRGECEIRLRPKTFAVLRYLAERPGHLVSTGELLNAVWPHVAVTDVMPRLCVRELRAALGDDAHAPRCFRSRPSRRATARQTRERTDVRSWDAGPIWTNSAPPWGEPVVASGR